MSNHCFESWRPPYLQHQTEPTLAGSRWILGVFRLEKRECEEKAVGLAATPVCQFRILQSQKVKVKLATCTCSEELGYIAMEEVSMAAPVFSRALKNSFSCYLSMLHMAPIFFLFLIARDNGLQNGKGISSENGLSFCLHGWMNGEVGANSRRFTPDLAW